MAEVTCCITNNDEGVRRYSIGFLEKDTTDFLSKWDDQSLVTVPTVVSSTCNDHDDECETDSCSCDSHSTATFSIGFNCVSFDLVPQVQEIPNRFSYTAEEVDATWYGRREKEVMRDAAYGIAESLDYRYFQNEFGQPTSTSFRGLESYTKEGSQQRKLNRVKNLVAVLREQRRQRACGEVVTNGPEFLEAACRSVSSQSMKLAYLQGIVDERDAHHGADGKRPTDGVDKSPNVLLQLTQLLRATSEGMGM